jgi:hypothetical protein
MDTLSLDQILTPEEKDLLPLFFTGGAIVSKFNEKTEQTTYIFKFFDKYYKCTTCGKSYDDLECLEELNFKRKREIISFLLSNINKIQLDSYLEKGKVTLIDNYYHSRILWTDEGFVIWSDENYWYGSDLKEVITILINAYDQKCSFSIRDATDEESRN